VCFGEEVELIIYNMYVTLSHRNTYYYNVCSSDVRKCANRNKNNKCSSVLLLQPRLDKNGHIIEVRSVLYCTIVKYY